MESDLQQGDTNPTKVRKRSWQSALALLGSPTGIKKLSSRIFTDLCCVQQPN